MLFRNMETNIRAHSFKNEERRPRGESEGVFFTRRFVELFVKIMYDTTLIKIKRI